MKTLRVKGAARPMKATSGTAQTWGGITTEPGLGATEPGSGTNSSISGSNGSISGATACSTEPGLGTTGLDLGGAPRSSRGGRAWAVVTDRPAKA